LISKPIFLAALALIIKSAPLVPSYKLPKSMQEARLGPSQLIKIPSKELPGIGLWVEL